MKKRVSRWRAWAEFWFVVRTFLRSSREVREGFGLFAALANHLDVRPHGVQIIVWLLPHESRYGHGGCVEPLKEDGNNIVGAPSVETASSGAGGYTLTVDFAKGRIP